MREYTFEFKDPSLEESIDRYIKRKRGEEVYICIFGLLEPSKTRNVFKIEHLLPLPNCTDKDRNIYCLPPEYLDAVVLETESFTGMRFLGFVHNHPGTRSVASKADIAYAGRMRIDWGDRFESSSITLFTRCLMAIVGERKTMRVYHVEMSHDRSTYTITPIKGKTFKYKVLTRRY